MEKRMARDRTMKGKQWHRNQPGKARMSRKKDVKMNEMNGYGGTSQTNASPPGQTWPRSGANRFRSVSHIEENR